MQELRDELDLENEAWSGMMITDKLNQYDVLRVWTRGATKLSAFSWARRTQKEGM